MLTNTSSCGFDKQKKKKTDRCDWNTENANYLSISLSSSNSTSSIAYTKPLLLVLNASTADSSFDLSLKSENCLWRRGLVDIFVIREKDDLPSFSLGFKKNRKRKGCRCLDCWHGIWTLLLIDTD